MATLAYLALRLAYADYLYHQGRFQRAAELVPIHPDYQYRAGNLRRALELNPYLSAAWLELAVTAEAGSDYAEAERCLLEAARLDKTFEPRWALANFYLRRDRLDGFWPWLRLAAERSYGDRTALFRLAWRASSDAALILAEAIPNQPALLAQYLDFLLTEHRSAAYGAAEALLPIATTAEAPVLLKACDQWIESDQVEQALAIWNRLIRRSLLAYQLLDPVAGVSLSNAALDVQPSGRGFDWRLPWRAGVYSTWSRLQRHIRIELSGRQEERVELIAQLLPVIPGTGYRLRYRYRTQGLAAHSGVRWLAGAVVSEALGSEQRRDASFEFRAAAPLVRLMLVYQREPGTVRPQGTIVLDGAFSLERIRIE
ncbi:MAG: hypothetical protein HY235_11205 [Acidobacteria bacterium]|nr:hypothetical protein [Acidobacteriota bacterium]